MTLRVVHKTQSVLYEAELLVDGEVVQSSYSADQNPQFVYIGLPRLGKACAVQVNVQLTNANGSSARYRGNGVAFDCMGLAASDRPVNSTPMPMSLTAPEPNTTAMPTAVP